MTWNCLDDFGIQVDLNDVNVIDIAFDGADEVDGQMNLIKVNIAVNLNFSCELGASWRWFFVC